MEKKNVALILVIIFMFGLLGYELMLIEQGFRDSILTDEEKCERRCAGEGNIYFMTDGMCYCKESVSFEKSYRCLTDFTHEDSEKYSVKFNTSSMRNLAVSSAIKYGSPNSIATRLFAVYKAVGDRVHYISDPRQDEYIAGPRETWDVRGGDCDDLSLLLASMYEAIGLDASIVEAFNETVGHVFLLVKVDQDLDAFLRDFKPLVEKHTPYFGIKPFNFIIFRETPSECEYSEHNLYMGESVKPFYVVVESSAQGYPGKQDPFSVFNQTRFINVGQ